MTDHVKEKKAEIFKAQSEYWYASFRERGGAEDNRKSLFYAHCQVNPWIDLEATYDKCYLGEELTPVEIIERLIPSMKTTRKKLPVILGLIDYGKIVQSLEMQGLILTIDSSIYGCLPHALVKTDIISDLPNVLKSREKETEQELTVSGYE